MKPQPWLLYGSVLSPFSVKLRAGCRWMELPFRWLPQQGSVAENCRAQVLRLAAGRGLLRTTSPSPHPLDDAPPLVPYLFGPEGELLQDSTAAIRWLDTHVSRRPTIRPRDPVARFVGDLVEEALDEWGLYLLHHNRWVVSGAASRYDEVIAAEFGRWMPDMIFTRARERFAARQVRRLPYLGSVAAAEATRDSQLPRDRRPPTRADFPSTHDLLDQSFGDLLNGLEALLADRPWLLGAGPSPADLALCGMLESHLAVDPVTVQAIAEQEHLSAWLERAVAARAEDICDDPARPLDALEHLRPLITVFVELMSANERAYSDERARGNTRFNEAAFDRGEALFQVDLGGAPFRTVVKTFQIRVWRDLQRTWRGANLAAQASMSARCPELRALDLSEVGAASPRPR